MFDMYLMVWGNFSQYLSYFAKSDSALSDFAPALSDLDGALALMDSAFALSDSALALCSTLDY
jgi:hypothetical protein